MGLTVQYTFLHPCSCTTYLSDYPLYDHYNLVGNEIQEIQTTSQNFVMLENFMIRGHTLERFNDVVVQTLTKHLYITIRCFKQTDMEKGRQNNKTDANI